MTPTILGDKTADTADKATGTLVRSIDEFNGAVARFIFPGEGYSRADIIGLTTDLQIASLRLWLAAVEAPVRMIAGVSLPPSPDAAVAVPVQPGLQKPVVAKAAPPKAAAMKPSVPVAKAPLAQAPASDKAGTVVVPFRRGEPAKPQAVIADTDSSSGSSRAKAVPPQIKAPEDKSLAPRPPVSKSLASAKPFAPAKPSAPKTSSSNQSALAKPLTVTYAAPKSATSKPATSKPATSKPATSKPVPALAIAATLPLAAKSIDPSGDFDDAVVPATAPTFLAGPEGKADDLLIIKGIGPKLNQLLHDLGIWHYRQIANWTPGEITWINAKLDFKGRVQRERWVRQARELAGQSAA